MAGTGFPELKAIWEETRTATKDIRDTAGIKKIVDPVTVDSVTNAVDVSDRAARQLGEITGAVDVSDRAARVLGQVTGTVTADVSDRAERILGAVTGTVNVGSVANPVDVSDRAARVLGKVTQDAQPTVITFTPSVSGWTPGASRATNVYDLTASPGIYAIGLAIDCDQPIEAAFAVAPAGGTSSIPTSAPAQTYRARVTLPPTPEAGCAEYIPAFRPLGGRYLWNFYNRGDAVPTRFTAYLYHYSRILSQPQNVRMLAIRNLEIRDTSQHNYSTNPNNIYLFVRFPLGGGKIPIYVHNGLNQAVKINVVMRLAGLVGDFSLGVKEFAAGASGVITNFDFPGLDVPSEIIDLRPECTVAPTSGALNAWLDGLIGGV